MAARSSEVGVSDDSKTAEIPAPDRGAKLFNTDQGSQFTGAAFSGALTDNGIAISMECRQDFTKHHRSGCFSGVLRFSAAQSWREGSGNV
jgi:hypothetical protein